MLGKEGWGENVVITAAKSRTVNGIRREDGNEPRSRDQHRVDYSQANSYSIIYFFPPS
jgi:hypothetical protein